MTPPSFCNEEAEVSASVVNMQRTQASGGTAF